MSFINIEIKARTQLAEDIRNFLLENNALFKGVDHQTDTYFNASIGRLKLRQGNIENNLIYYEREDKAGPKQSDFKLVAVQDAEGLKQALSLALGIKVVVSKKREIYFIENVKFHIDELEGLGKFVEIEASNKYKDLPIEKLRAQCDYYMNALKIRDEDLVQQSYSDMLL
jgi:adenylate cyclase, class 2